MKKDNANRSRPRPMTNAYANSRSRNQRELAEDYVELIDDLIKKKGEARAVDLAQRLGVSHVTVSKTIGRLKDAGLVHSQPYRSIFLTHRGRKLATQSRERHHLVTNFLLEIGVPEKVAVMDAEGIEHHASPATLAAMRKFIQARS